MFQSDIQKLYTGSGKALKITTMSLYKDMQLVVMIHCEDENIQSLVYNRILDGILDKIQRTEVYKDFSLALEYINSLLNSLKDNSGTIPGLKALVGVYAENMMYFSAIGELGVYLYNSNKDIIEITDKRDVNKEFHYISSGKIIPGETLIFSSFSLLDILSRDDIHESIELGDTHKAAKNLISTLSQEHHSDDVGILLLQKESFHDGEEIRSQRLESIKYFFIRCCDNHFIKTCVSYIYMLRDYVREKGRIFSQIFFGAVFLGMLYVLYLITSSFFTVESQNDQSVEYKNMLLAAQNNIITASESINNPDVFLLEIEKAQSAINTLESQKLFLADNAKLQEEIYMLQKQFNGVEIYTPGEDDIVYGERLEGGVVRVLGSGNKIFVVTKTSVIGPIFTGQEPPVQTFNEFEKDDIFIDAAFQGSDIILITDAGKLVKFSSEKFFSYLDVTGQELWENTPLIDSYASNIYLLSEDRSQILRHKRRLGSYAQGDEYLTEADSLSIGRILSLAVDGGIYILKSDGSMLKLFRSPEYRLESLLINKLPDNYDFKNLNAEKLPSIRARIDLKYVYMLLDERIYVFKPNSNRYQDTKNLTYVGQLEAGGSPIEDFYVEDDGKLFIARSDGLFRLDFEVEDDGILIR